MGAILASPVTAKDDDGAIANSHAWQFEHGRRLMSASNSRFVAFWAAHERRALVYGRLLGVTLALLAVSLVNTYRAWNRPREVVRIGCDGIPQLVRVNDDVYSEPDEREIHAFAVRFAVRAARADSFSVVNDYLDILPLMAPELRERFHREARGTAEQPGAVQVVQNLQRRTQIDPSMLTITVDKRPYPWRVNVRGTRQIVGQGVDANEKFEMDLELVRASRNEVVEGLLVYGMRTKGDPLAVGKSKRPQE